MGAAGGIVTLRPPAIVAAALGAALASGALVVHRPGLALAVVAAGVFMPLVFTHFTLGLCAWLVLASVAYSGLVDRGPFIATIAALLAWFALLRRSDGPSFDGTPLVFAGMAILVVWLTLSIGWADDRGMAWRGARDWYSAAAAFVLVATSLRSPQHVRMIVLAFVIGELASIGIGIIGAGTSTTIGSTDLATQRRFSGGAGDPNFLAAGLIGAVALSAGLLSGLRHAAARMGLLAALVVLTVGFVATESRGGLVAAGAALAAALIMTGRRRRLVVVSLVGLAIVAGAAFVARPDALQRVTSLEPSSGPRRDLWRMAWRMADDHPAIGVGLYNFDHLAASYVRRPGTVRYADLIVDKPHAVHNIYLQQLAETGVVGLTLLLSVIAGCLRAGVVAARRFDEHGDAAMATLARAAVVGAIAMLTASMFISNGGDLRMWALLALCPAMATITARKVPPP